MIKANASSRGEMMKFVKEMASQKMVQVGGGTYLLFAFSVGLAAMSWTNFFFALVQGVFWPVTLIYWTARALHHIASSSVLNL